MVLYPSALLIMGQFIITLKDLIDISLAIPVNGKSVSTFTNSAENCGAYCLNQSLSCVTKLL